MDRVLLNRAEVLSKYDVTYKTLWRWMKERGFPQPCVKLTTHKVWWDVKDVEAWENRK